MALKVISISLPEALLTQLDVATEEEFTNRSDFIRQIIVERLKQNKEFHARLAAIALNNDIPTEEELYKLLKMKWGMRQARVMRREIRQSYRTLTRGRGL